MMTAIAPSDAFQLKRVPDRAIQRFALVEQLRDRPGNFGDVDVAVAIDANPMRRHELIRIFTLSVIAELADQAAVETPDTDARTHRLCAVPDREEAVRADARPPRGTQLADITELLRARRIDTHPARQRHPVPDRLEPAIRREDLHPIVVPVRYVNVSIAIGRDIVRQVELARLVARLAP